VNRTHDEPFDESWQARAYVLVELTAKATGTSPEDFRTHLIAAIAAEPDRAYWDSWVKALDTWIAELDVPRSELVEASQPSYIEPAAFRSAEPTVAANSSSADMPPGSAPARAT
jgi:hypothetical protein